MFKRTGKTIVKGLGFGIVTKIKPLTYNKKRYLTDDSMIRNEISLANHIYKKAINEIKNEINENKNLYSKEVLEIIEGHIILIKDGEITDEINKIIQTEKIDFTSSVLKTQNKFMQIFESMKDPYMQARSADIKDICQRLIKIKQKHQETELKGIILAKEITPSDILSIEPQKVQGILSEQNTENCHAAILARTLNIPFITHLDNIYQKVNDYDLILMDASKASIIVNPDEKTHESFLKEYNKYIEKQNKLKSYIGQPAILKDGSEIDISVNIGNEKDVEVANKLLLDSIGLFRSEYLYMNLNDFPDENYLYKKYQSMTKDFSGEIIIRTLDIGGDKSIDYFKIPKEDNPYLGYRAIRYCLEHKDVLKTQLKAILRLTTDKDIKIMVPMISSYDEVIEFKKIFNETKIELRNNHTKFNEATKIGIMIETPASVLISDILAEELDFFSIGTNDLLQYTMAADRNNVLTENNYSPYALSFLRIIELAVNNAKKHNIPVSVCGEFASKTYNIPLLIALGIEKISVHPGAVLELKAYLSNITRDDCDRIYENIKNIKSEKELKNKISGW